MHINLKDIHELTREQLCEFISLNCDVNMAKLSNVSTAGLKIKAGNIAKHMTLADLVDVFEVIGAI